MAAACVRPMLFTCAVGGSSWFLSAWYHKSHCTRRNHAALSPSHYNNPIAKLFQWWRRQSFDDKFFMSIASINGSIWLCWKVKRLQPFLLKYFMTAPKRSNSVSSLLLCTFSHLEVWHLAVNMAVLWSFTPSFINVVGEEWCLPFYLTSGTFASMCGHYFKVIKGVSPPSLGASGALLAIATLVILNNPDSMLYIIFLPFIPIPAYLGLGGIVCFDAIGLVRGWRLFDHAAHLGGVLFAMSYNVVRNLIQRNNN